MRAAVNFGVVHQSGCHHNSGDGRHRDESHQAMGLNESAGEVRRDLVRLCDDGQFLAAHVRLLDSGLDAHLNPSLWELLERRATEAGDAVLAHRLRCELLTADAASHDIVLSEARHEIEHSRLARARILVERVFGDDPEEREARILLGVALAREDRTAALSLLDGAENGTETEILWVIDALRSMGALERARALCEAALKRFPLNGTFQNRLGWLAEGIGDFAQAIAVAEIGLHGDTDSKAQATNRLIRLYRRLGDRPKALELAADLMALDATPMQKLRGMATLGQSEMIKSFVGALPQIHAHGRIPESDATRVITFLLDEGLVGLALYLVRAGFPMDANQRRILERRGLGKEGVNGFPRHLEEAAAIRSPTILFPLDAAHSSFHMPEGWFPALRDGDSILLVNSVLAAGGAERQFVMVARALVAAGMDPGRIHAALFSLERDRGHDHFEATLRETGIHVHDLSQRDLSMLAMPDRDGDVMALLPARLRDDTLTLYHLAAELKPAVVHGWQDRSAIAAGLVARLLGIKRSVLSARNMRPRRRGEDADWIARAVYGEVLQDPSVTITANATDGARDYEEWLGLPFSTVPVLANAVDDTFFVRPCAALAPDAPIKLLGVFRLAENKRPLLWVETVAALRRNHGLRITPRLVGTGPLANKVRQHANSLGLSDLRIDPPIADPSSIYRDSDALILLSQVEGTPNVVLEAQASGLPVAACRVGGVADALHRSGDGAGLLLDPEVEAEEAARAIAQWLPGARQAAPDDRVQFVRDGYSIETLGNSLLRLYGAQA